MEKDSTADTFRENRRFAGHISGEESLLSFWLGHDKDLIQAFQEAKSVDQNSLTNMINHINFMDGYVLVCLRHPKYKENIIIKAHPEPCLGKELSCRWSGENRSDLKPENYQFLHLIIDDGQYMIVIPAVLRKITKDGFTIQLPDRSYTVGQRRIRRYPCQGILVELAQSGFFAKGELLDFSPVGFRISVKPRPPCSFFWFDPDELVTIHLQREGQILFSEVCKCIRQKSRLEQREIVLETVDSKTNHLKNLKLRNPRQHLIPSPTLIFDHPFIRKSFQFEVKDISTSGLSVYEEADEGVLLSGMIIPELAIHFSGDLKIKCNARVVYRLDKNENGIRCGIAFLDMDINTYSRLTQILTNTLDPHSYISSEVDMDALWEFFFKSGFIYPQKYRLIHSHRGDLKKTYQKLYQKSPEIAKHFTYQKNGQIYSHLSIVKAYERAWMIQHHASRAIKGRRPGFMVLKQIMHYLKDLHRLPSAKIDYVFSYFRPESKFPDRVFGGFARALKNPKGCSLDLFSYLPFLALSRETRLQESWLLQECSSLDLQELSRFYNYRSGGLLLDILGLKYKNSSDESIENLYNKVGLMRRWKAYSLTRNGELNAVLIVNQSNLGFNMSDLLNCIKILVTDTVNLPWEILSTAINQLSSIYETERVPILIYPSEYLEFKNPSYEIKKYLLWIYDACFVGQFIEYLERRFRIKYWK